MIVKELPPYMVYKLHEGDDPNGMMGAMLREASPHINRGRMSAKVIISRESPDRSRDVVITKGGIFTDHRKIPIACVNHNKNYVAGMAEDRFKNYTVKIKGLDAVEAETFFCQRTELGEQSFRLVEDGVFRGASIGFLPVGIVTKSHAGGNLYSQWNLIEYSHLPIPDHPDCIVEAIYKSYSGKALCDPLANILKPMVPERPASVVSGFTGDTVEINGVKYVPAEVKPANCTCADWPKMKLRNGSTHFPDCPVHQEWLGAGGWNNFGSKPSLPDQAANLPLDNSDASADARRVFDAATHREVNGWQIVKDEHAGVCEYVVRDPSKRTEAYRHGKWEAVKQWAELNSVPFDSAMVKSWDESKHERDHGKFASTGGASGETTTHADGSSTTKYRTSFAGYADKIGKHKVASGKKVTLSLEGASKLGIDEHAGKRIRLHSIRKWGETYWTAHAGYEIFEKSQGEAIKKAAASKEGLDFVDHDEPSKKSLSAPPVTKTYLQRMRIKAMNPEDDDTLQGATAPVDDTLPPDPNAAPVDPNADAAAEDMDGMTDQMKPFAQMCHTAHEQLLQITQGLEAALGDTEHPGAAKMAEKVKAAVGKAMATVTAAFGDYKNAHPDQPDIPGAEVAPEGMDDESEDGDEDEDDFDDTDEDDGIENETDDTEDDSGDEPKPKSKEKAWAQYSVKCLQNYWDYINSKAFAGDKPAMDAAAKLLSKVAADKRNPLRNEARVVVKQLRGGIVTKAANDDAWAGFKPEDFAALQKQVGTLTTAMGSLTS